MLAKKVLSWNNDTADVPFKKSTLVVFTEHGVEVLYKKQHYKIVIENFKGLQPSAKEAIKKYLPDIIDCAYYLEHGVFPSTLTSAVSTARVIVREVKLNELLMNVLTVIAIELDPDIYFKLKELLKDDEVDAFAITGIIADELRERARTVENEIAAAHAVNQERILQNMAIADEKKAYHPKTVFSSFKIGRTQAV